MQAKGWAPGSILNSHDHDVGEGKSRSCFLCREPWVSFQNTGHHKWGNPASDVTVGRGQARCWQKTNPDILLTPALLQSTGSPDVSVSLGLNFSSVLAAFGNVFWKWEVYIRMHVCVHIYIHTYTYITRTVRTQNVSVCVSWESYHIWQRCGWRLKLILNFCQVLWASGSPKQSMMISHTESLSLNNQWSWKWFKFITLPGQPSVASVGVFVRRLHIPVNLIYSSMLYGVRHFSWDICVCAHI